MRCGSPTDEGEPRPKHDQSAFQRNPGFQDLLRVEEGIMAATLRGLPALAGVAVLASGELESEVALVLALLADTDAECERLITWARREAEQIVAAARSAVRAITTDAAWRADTVREQAAQQVLTAARKQAARTTQAAAQQAAQIRELARQRMPVLVSRVVGTIRQLQAEEP